MSRSACVQSISSLADCKVMQGLKEIEQIRSMLESETQSSGKVPDRPTINAADSYGIEAAAAEL